MRNRFERCRLAILAGAALVLGGFGIARPLQAAAPAATPPVVPGHARLVEGKADAQFRGEVLLGELNCLSCHKSDNAARVQARSAPDLAAIGSRATPQWIRNYVESPHSMKPGTPMPDIFHASEAQAKAGAADFLTHYLVSLGGPIKPASVEGDKQMADAGQKLFHTIGCVACHAPIDKAGKPVDTKSPSVPLGNLAAKTTVDQLAAFLLDPHASRPSGRMPYLKLTGDEARAISVYLLREQLENPQTKDAAPVAVSGVKYTYWPAAVKDCKIETLEKLKAKPKTGKLAQFAASVPGGRPNDYVIRYDTGLKIEKAGKYTFYVTSDDGSRLYVNGKQIIDNDGIHPPTLKSGTADLKPGIVPVILTFSQGGAGAELKVEWSGPDIKKQPIPADLLTNSEGRPMVPLGSEPFTLDPQKVQMGKQFFGMLGCAACHQVPGTQAREYKPLATLDINNPMGCLGTDGIRKGVPNYQLSDVQRDDLKAVVKNAAALATALTPKEQVAHSMAAMNCYACHKRDNLGGVPDDRQSHFQMTAEFDMGEEGRLPPSLTGVGEKLKPAALEQIVTAGNLHIRTVLATRMPVFNKPAVGAMLAALPVTDTQQAQAPRPVSAFSEKAVKDGRQLFGVRGLGCVNCHGVLGQKSLGMPAPDLTTAHERLTHAWYAKLMHDPTSINAGTRMPGFWLGGNVILKDIAGGTPDGQIDAIYHYLSLGQSMALPAGLGSAAGKTELQPVDEPILHRTFFNGVGPRTIAVGYPEQLSVAFDANLVRLAVVWRGKFFDAKGMWDGRGGTALGPLGTDVLKLPAAATFATLSDSTTAWPKPAVTDPNDGAIERNAGGKFLGYELDADKRPIFKYRQGDLEIREQPLPKLRPGGAAMIRRFELSGKADNLYVLAATGKTIEAKSAGEYLIDGKVTVKLTGLAADKAAIRDADGGKQLIVPVPLNAGKATFDLETTW